MINVLWYYFIDKHNLSTNLIPKNEVVNLSENIC